MPRPLPFDRSPAELSSLSTRTSPPSSSALPPSTPRSGRRVESTPSSPFYGLEPEVVARHLVASNRADSSPSSDSNLPDPIPPSTTSITVGSDRTRRSSASALNPIRPPSRIRTPSPPPHAFDGNESSTSAWLRWLGERRARRVEAEGGDSRRAAENPNDPLRRLRQSAERLRTVESRVAIAERSPAMTSPPTAAGEAYDESRRLLVEVRQRLEDTRTRIEDARHLVQDDGTTQEREQEGLVQARQGLDRTVAFASRLGQLAATLTDLSERAALLSSSTTRSFIPSARPTSYYSPLPTTPIAPFESPTSASQTDSIRHTVRQLVVASRRVSTAIDRHRAQQGDSPSLDATSVPPLPPTDLPLRVSFPSPLRTSSLSSAAPNVVSDPLRSPTENTSPNPEGLLLPTQPLTRSPLSLPLETSPLITPPNRENYPGERAQLLRIASLQRDIAERALELRDLRARGRDLDREERETRRARTERDEDWQSILDEADKEDEEDEEGAIQWTVRRLGREVEVEACSSGDETVRQSLSRPQTNEERKRRYELYSVCGR